jgi:Beta propeller domain
MEPREALRHRDMTRRRSRAGAAVLACLTIAATSCTAGISLHPAPKASPHGKPAPQAVIKASLTAFHSSDALAALRGAAEASVTPYGMPEVAGASPRTGVAYAASGVATAPEAAAAAAPADAVGGAANSSAAPPTYSGTNDYTADVDEPDLVKTDGRRIATFSAHCCWRC